MNEFFTASPALAWSIVSIMLAMATVVALWERVKWWWINTWYSFPFVGRLASLSKDVNRDRVNPEWFKAERALCRDFKKFIRVQDERDFNEMVTYLTKAGDLGRHPTPLWIWLLTVALVVVEALGFTYVLAGYTIPGASENTQKLGGLGIAFMISIILVGFTHWAGHHLYVNQRINNARRQWVESGQAHDLYTGEISLARPQGVDDDKPHYTQVCNRTGTQVNSFPIWATVFIVFVIAIGATYVRGQVLEKQLLQQVTGQTKNIELGVSATADGLDLTVKNAPIQLPPADAKLDQSADTRAVVEEASLDRHGGWGTFIILAFVFVFLQILSVMFGYKWGFAGKESKEAYFGKGGGRFSTYSDVREHYQQIADTAQAKLEALQQMMQARMAKIGQKADLKGRKTFFDFMHEARAEQLADRQSEKRQTVAKAQVESTPVIPSPLPSPKPSTMFLQQPAGETQPPDCAVEDVMAKLAEMDDKDAKKAFIANLPDALCAQVKARLKADKEKEDQKRRQLDQELDDLL